VLGEFTIGEYMKIQPAMKSKRVIKISAVLVLVLIGLGAWYLVYSYRQINAEMASLIQSLPNTGALAVYSFDRQSELVGDGNSLFRNADTPLLLGSTMKIVILAAYADAVTSGVLNPSEQVPVKDLERYYLPLTDGNAHKSGLESTGLAVDELGYAKDPMARLTINDIARIMIHFSGNAETDYLIERIGAERISSVMDKIGMQTHSPIIPYLGITLAMLNHETSATSESELNDPNRLQQLYLKDPVWQKAQIDYLLSGKVQTSMEAQAAWMEKLGVRGTAREYASVMARVASGTLISPEVSRIMQEKLTSVPADWPLRLLFYNKLGDKDGAAPGVLSLASYMTPTWGINNGKSRVVVIILNQIPLETWLKAFKNNGIYLFSAGLANQAGSVYKE
jgi:D-alanyl-D-alanine carboxypeptidase